MGGVVRKAIRLLRLYKQRLDQAGLIVVIFLAMIVAALLESQTHQIFHARSFWFVLALQEMLLFNVVVLKHDERLFAGRLSEPSRDRSGMAVQPDAVSR